MFATVKVDRRCEVLAGVVPAASSLDRHDLAAHCFGDRAGFFVCNSGGLYDRDCVPREQQVEPASSGPRLIKDYRSRFSLRADHAFLALRFIRNTLLR